MTLDYNSCALILAAGMSTRMKGTKQLLNVKGQHMLSKVIHQVLKHPFNKVYAIIGHEAEQIQNKVIVDDSRFEWLMNHDYKLGQSTSLKLGINKALQTTDNIFIFLGDLPFVEFETIQTLIQESDRLRKKQDSTFLLRPICHNKIGHPVFIGNMTKVLNDKINGDYGLKSIKDEIPLKIKIPVKDAGIFQDIDTLEDCKRLL